MITRSWPPCWQTKMRPSGASAKAVGDARPLAITVSWKPLGRLAAAAGAIPMAGSEETASASARATRPIGVMRTSDAGETVTILRTVVREARQGGSAGAPSEAAPLSSAPPAGTAQGQRPARTFSMPSIVRGTSRDSSSGPDEVSRIESSIRTPMFLYFSTAGATAALNARFSGVSGS